MKVVPTKKLTVIVALAMAVWGPSAPVAASPGVTCAQAAAITCRNNGWVGLGYSSEQQCRQVEAEACHLGGGPGPGDPGPCNPSDAWPC
jgi:hypothetical protein